MIFVFWNKQQLCANKIKIITQQVFFVCLVPGIKLRNLHLLGRRLYSWDISQSPQQVFYMDVLILQQTLPKGKGSISFAYSFILLIIKSSKYLGLLLAAYWSYPTVSSESKTEIMSFNIVFLCPLSYTIILLFLHLCLLLLVTFKKIFSSVFLLGLLLTGASFKTCSYYLRDWGRTSSSRPVWTI